MAKKNKKGKKLRVGTFLKNTLPIYELDDLQEIFDYPNRRALNRALRSGALPIKIFKLRGVRVCHTAAVENYFDDLKAEGMATIEKHAPADTAKPVDWDQ